MGISIHYSGRFNEHAVLPELITEVKEIAEAYGWNYHVHLQHFPRKMNEDGTYDGKIYGISFTPPGCETVSVSFLSNYRMSDAVNLSFYGEAPEPSEREFVYMLSAKTQFAGPAIHKIIISIFRHLYKRNYFSEFKLIDEGAYWETGDENLLVQKFKENGALIDSFRLAVETTPQNKGESLEKYFERLIKILDAGKRKQSPKKPGK